MICYTLYCIAGSAGGRASGDVRSRRSDREAPRQLFGPCGWLYVAIDRSRYVPLLSLVAIAPVCLEEEELNLSHQHASYRAGTLVLWCTLNMSL